MTLGPVLPHAWSSGGEASATADDGREILIFGGVPGEACEVELLGAGQHRIAAVWSQASAHSLDRRLEVPCRIWQQCRSCDWIHLTDVARAREKRDSVCRALDGVGLSSDSVSAICFGSQAFAYRARAIYSWDPEAGRLGGHARGTHDIIDTLDCPIHHPDHGRLAAVVAEHARHSKLRETLRYLLARRSRAGALQVVLTLRPRGSDSALALLPRLHEAAPGVPLGLFSCEVPDSSNRVSSPPYRHLHGPAELIERVGDLRLSLGPGDFFQANPALAEDLAEHLLTLAAIEPGDRALDLYCGVGPHALGLAQRGARVLGVERSLAAIEAARRNAIANGIDGAEFSAGPIGEDDPEAWIRTLGGPPRVVVVNPPRRGLEPAVPKQIERLGPERLIYVSCAPEALARDAAALREVGYRLVDAWPYDLLPQTRHVETLALLRR